jgi:serine/threonine protein kinase HipA of HipAB toxin-antitoxin module
VDNLRRPDVIPVAGSRARQHLDRIALSAVAGRRSPARAAPQQPTASQHPSSGNNNRNFISDSHLHCPWQTYPHRATHHYYVYPL